MWEKLRVVFTIPELRQKIFLTLFLLAVYRVGYWVPLPVIDQEKIAQISSEGSFGDILNKVAVLSASQLQQATIFGLGIMPYISASIIFQLLGTVWKPIEELRKEGEAGRKKINEYTRYVTVLLCLLQSTAYVWWYVMRSGLVDDNFQSSPGDASSMYWSWQITCVLIMTCGTVFLMWLGEQIDEYGIGNGISLLIMAGIVAQMPGALTLLFSNAEFTLTGFNSTGIEVFLVLAILFVAVVLGVVFITLGQRRIPTQSAKHVRGRRVYGGTRQYLPLKINQAGVMPIIFASSLLLIPNFFFKFLGQYFKNSPILETTSEMFGSPNSLVYNVVYVGMIYFFCYFWTAITFNPKEMSENLKDSGTFIPGYRPGKTTADYLEKVMVRITYVGAGFLALVAIVPTVVATALKVDPLVANFYGGTGLLIAVSVGFDLVQKIDSHLVMRNYRGLLE
ncbi:MAG: preprotein translocase subunit SecY [Planctomycetota bacterium]|jgi:preprotein translocase subunit SecY|nr:preprotein translocase subunit SecY [Planctomycetota bacterium]